MKTTLNNILIFTAGAAIGSAVTWHYVKTKYEQIAQEEIDSVKEVFARRERKPEPEVEETNNIPDENPDIKEYVAKVTDAGYINYSGVSKPEAVEDSREKEAVDVDKPYVIKPEEFDEIDDYATVSLTYYSDGILADEEDDPVNDIDGLVGSESLTHFGEYEDDSVFVRNDVLRTDYEILLDSRKYSDVNRYPPLAEDE